MLISWKWLQNLVETGDVTAADAAARITARGLEVEGHTPDPTHIADIRVGRMVKIVEHPNSDHLHLVDVDDGGQELVRVVCGAPGIQEGWLVPFAPIGANLGDFKIKKSKLRGEVSCGMLCSERELGLGPDHSGLMRLDDSAVPGAPVTDALAIGVPAGIAAYHTDIFEVGLTPDRGDCLSHYGVARELAAALHAKVRDIALADLDAAPEGDFVSIENGDDCPRYMGILIEGVKVGPSPAWLRRAVEACGARSINNVVDITNFVCFELGHPMHAFDADKLAARKIAVRRARAGEKLYAINHETYDLNDTDVVITDGTKPIALAGVMGGADTEVDENTTNIIFETATFHPTRVRKTSKRLGLHSESSHRFERFVDANGVDRAARRAVWLLQQTTDCRVVSVDDRYVSVVDPVHLSLRTARVKEILGVAFSGTDLRGYLEPIGFVAENWDTDEIRLQAPTWRADITREIDIIEEICRGYGFDNFPATLPDVSMKCPHTPYETPLNPTQYPVSANLYDRAERARLHTLRESLIGAGLDECMHYTFMDPADLDKMCFAPDARERSAMKIANPMSVEHSTMRTTMVPSMLAALQKNMANQQKSCALFEVGEVFYPCDAQDSKLVHRPVMIGGWNESERKSGITCLDETQRLCILYWGETSKPWYGAARKYDAFDCKGAIESVFQALETPIAFDQDAARVPWLHDNIQAAVVWDGRVIGHFGELHPSVCRNYKIDGPVYVAEIDLDGVLKSVPGLLRMKPLPRFHFSQRDLSITVSKDVSLRSIGAVIESVRPAELESWSLFDVYSGKQIQSGMQSVSLTFVYRHPDAHDAEKGRPLTDDEVAKAHQTIVDALNAKLGSTLR